MRRASHQLVDNPKVLDDPLAVGIVGQESVAEASSLEGSFSRFIRAFMAVRSRYAEDQLARAVSLGMRQYVVLGAGLDTFAYRNPYSGLRVFEVDHPATQAWKRERLATANIPIPSSVTFAPVDFEHQTLAAGLAEAGLHQEATFFSWLGVVPYLTRDAITSTFRYIAQFPAPTGVAFDYAVPRSSLNLVGKLALDAISARVARAGEPFQTFFDPAELAQELRSIGFGEIEDLDRDVINSRYFANRSDKLRVGGHLGRLMCAWI